MTVTSVAPVEVEASPPTNVVPVPRPTSRVREILIGAGVAVLSGVVIAAALKLPSNASNFVNSPVFWPLILGILTLVGGIAIAVVGARKSGTTEEDPVSLHGVVQLAIFIPAIVLYGLLWQWIHFVPITLVLVAGLSLLLGGRGWRALILFPVIVTAILFGVFGLLLRVPL